MVVRPRRGARPGPRRAPGLALLLAASAALVAGLADPVAASPASPVPWRRPVDGPVVRPFAPPATRYGAGHLGVDLAAAPGSVVRAAGAGTVVFAGSVAGTLHVVVAHPGGLRTSYSFLHDVAVRRGRRVVAGTVLGHTGGRGSGHDGSVLHLGLRAGDRYVDPMSLFRTVDLAAVVHLAPLRRDAGTTSTSERASLRSSLGLPRSSGVGPVARAKSTAGAAWHALTSGAARLAEAVGDVLAPAAHLVGRFARGLPDVLGRVARSSPVAVAAGTVLDVGRTFVDWVRSRATCDEHAPEADGTGGSGHRVLVVAGLGSHTSADGRTADLPVARLGYAPEEVSWFSYAPDGGSYTASDTYDPILRSARRLGTQLRALQRAEPGREVDLVAHSQGGVVVRTFLELVYDPSDPTYPPLGTVITLSSPHGGAPLASAATEIGTTRPGRTALRVAANAGLPPPGAPSVRDLAEGSDLSDRLDAARLPDQVDLTTVGAALDLVVPAGHAGLGASPSIVVDPVSATAHEAVLRDPKALSAVRAALEHRPLPCVGLGDALVASVAPTAITRVEHLAGATGAGLGAVADGLGRHG